MTVALLGNEWRKAVRLEATVAVVDDLSARMVVVDTTIVQLAGDMQAFRTELTDLQVRVPTLETAVAQLQAEVAALQTQSSATLQPQIDAINTKLANMAAALQ